MTQNELYPIFLKVHRLNILLVGGGFVGLEKLIFLLKSSPEAQVTIVAPYVCPEIEQRTKNKPIAVIKAPYSNKYLENKHLVIGATNDNQVNRQVWQDCKARNILVNVADTPDLCDFYLGGIVTKGHLKIAISTNGKSPTVAKRFRQFFEDIIPNDINVFLNNIDAYRKTLRGDLEEKLETLNTLTESLIKKKK